MVRDLRPEAISDPFKTNFTAKFCCRLLVRRRPASVIGLFQNKSYSSAPRRKRKETALGLDVEKVFSPEKVIKRKLEAVSSGTADRGN
jgi:hypothetical protein